MTFVCSVHIERDTEDKLKLVLSVDYLILSTVVLLSLKPDLVRVQARKGKRIKCRCRHYRQISQVNCGVSTQVNFFRGPHRLGYNAIHFKTVIAESFAV